MSATVTDAYPASATAAMTARSSRSRWEARTVGAGRRLRPRGRPGIPSWVRASVPPCQLSATRLEYLSHP